MMQGKLIVVEGIDGSGKSTQFKCLCERLRQEKADFHEIIFPRYSEPSSALLTMYLNGGFGKNPSDVNARAASVLYAVDRFASFRLDWGEIYKSGKIIVSDRYTTSNAVHQGAKLKQDELPAFFDWLYDFEYNIMELPVPDIVIYMDIDLNTALSQMTARQSATNTSGDIHETDAEYLTNCLRVGSTAADHYGWKRVSCLANGCMRTVEEIHEDVFSLIKGVL